MKTLMITGPNSNAGKTLITSAIIRVLRKRSLDIRAFKTGPDFIDTKYLSLASGKRAGNLDMHMMGEKGLKEALSLNNGDYGIVEGAMGYFDGIYNSYENSSFHMGKELNIPAVLIYTPQGEMFSAVPKIKGMVEFSEGLIKGVILNKTSESTYLMMKEIIEENIGIEVLGFLPYMDELKIESKSLGLKENNNEDMNKLLDLSSNIIENKINIDRLIDMMEEVDINSYEYPGKRDIVVAIARDQAFNFHYGENLSLLENICSLEYFSPLEDTRIPEADLIFIGGGYPELFKEELSANEKMINNMRELAEKDRFILGEGGGFMYLASTIEGYPMCNILKGDVTMTDKLQRFGYVNMELMEDTILGRKGSVLRGNEYHRSQMSTVHKPFFSIKKPKSKRNWQCGYSFKNTLGYYQHINFLGNMDNFIYLLDQIENKRKGG